MAQRWGKKLAPAYAKIYMPHWERTLFSKLTHHPLLYFRYLDDIFEIWSHGLDTYTEFLEIWPIHTILLLNLNQPPTSTVLIF